MEVHGWYSSRLHRESTLRFIPEGYIGDTQGPNQPAFLYFLQTWVTALYLVNHHDGHIYPSGMNLRVNSM